MTNQTKREDLQTGMKYEDLIAAFEKELGQFEPEIVGALVQKKAHWEEVESAVNKMAGSHGLMIFFKVNQGVLASLNNKILECTLYTVGNPLVAEKILSVDVRASLYVPFHICIYNNGEGQGATIGFDRPSSFLAALQNPALNEFGTLLDGKIDSVINSIKNNYK